MFECGPYLRASIFTKIGWQLDLLEREAPQYLLTQPSNLRLLLRELRRSGRRLPSLKLVRTQAEQFDPELRTECLDVLGVPVVDTYGAMEAGYIAIQCPEHGHYHIQSELNMVEILGEDGHPCAPGEIGRIVVTPLHAFSMPLFRYDLGDYAEVGEPCPCGRGLPVLRRIYGRHKELLTLPSGEKRFSTFGSRVFTKISAVAQFQIVQKSLTEIEVRIVADRPLIRIECDAITAGLAQQVGPEFSIRLVFVENIPRTSGGKYMEFISELDSRG
jgi:phenylacetate-CoA ligase